VNMHRLLGQMACGLAAALFSLAVQAAYDPAPAPAKAPPIKPVDAKRCYNCHDNIEEYHSNGRHATVNCAHCHDAVEHLKTAKNSSMGTPPVTRTDHAACAVCHLAQYNSFVQNNLASKAKIEKATFRSRSPLFDKLMEGYGFTFEHSEPRSHSFMLVDHYTMDRTYGLRFKFKDWTYISKAEDAAKDSWSVLNDEEPSTSEQKKFGNQYGELKQTALAANPVCLNCKSQDHILKWKYMGEKDPNAKWDRTSKVVDMARDLHHPLNCFMCHDPHSAGPRVVRDALINAVVDRKLGTYPMDPVKSQQITMTKVWFQRGGKDFRAIGLLNKPDSNLMCAQCHVEYNCGPGFDLGDAAKGKEPTYIKMDDPRTNLFPWVNVLGYKNVMTRPISEGGYNFKDFKHAGTGALLAKIQHPETETQWGSKHERAGVECKDCHMPKVKQSNDGKAYTWHGQRSARYMKHDTCVRCHKEWTDEEAEYQIDAIQNYIRGKMVKSEFWIGQLIDTMHEAKNAGVDAATMGKAKEMQYDATLMWEWWTAENSDGFHNPDLARKSLDNSMTSSRDAIKMLREAMAALKAPPAAPAK